jgi:type VI protein secretion system component VasK
LISNNHDLNEIDNKDLDFENYNREVKSNLLDLSRDEVTENGDDYRLQEILNEESQDLNFSLEHLKINTEEEENDASSSKSEQTALKSSLDKMCAPDQNVIAMSDEVYLDCLLNENQIDKRKLDEYNKSSKYFNNNLKLYLVINYSGK